MLLVVLIDVAAPQSTASKDSTGGRIATHDGGPTGISDPINKQT